MNILYTPYESLKNWRDNNSVTHQSSIDELHHFHELVIKNMFEIALKQMVKDFGQPPCDFAWFVMGSAGRCEQAIFSDQDHGIIYEETNKKSSVYFIEFGKRLGSSLNYLGYPYCDGNVMSSNRLWCRSINEWDEQIRNWIDEDRWETLRNLLIFLDARVIFGKEQYIQNCKKMIFQWIDKQPILLRRLFENTLYVGKTVGIFNQFLTESYGPYTGCINLKRSAFFPYVNAVRLLAIIEKIEETSTLVRLEMLSEKSEHHQKLDPYYMNFKKLLQIRLQQDQIKNYDDVHYLHVKDLNKEKKLELKKILHDGRKLQQYTGTVVNRKIKNEN